MTIPRRLVLKFAIALGVFLALFPWLRANIGGRSTTKRSVGGADVTVGPPLGSDADGVSRVYLVRNGSPEDNVKKAIEMMGGIEQFVGPEDIVVLKPNAQWWNQGMTNTDAMQGFIDLVLGIPGFSGEVICADNHQFQGKNSRGWTTEERNGRFNYNELVAFYQNKGHKNVTKYHWQVAGTASVPLEGDAQGDARVEGPEDGDGYVWMTDRFYVTPTGRKCYLTYPVFTSTYSGITIDLKNGAWKDGRFLDGKSVKFVNFSVLNHHGGYCGVTASVKNLMGVVDMTCGWPGDYPRGSYNTHHIGVSKRLMWANRDVHWRLNRLRQRFIAHCYRDFRYTGGVLGAFMREVRLPDLNIITAERVGWGHRTNVTMSERTRTVVASRDPVALDYLATREILLPATPPGARREDSGRLYRELNDPEKREGPFHRFLEEARRENIGTLDPARMKLIEYDFAGQADA